MFAAISYLTTPFVCDIQETSFWNTLFVVFHSDIDSDLAVFKDPQRRIKTTYYEALEMKSNPTSLNESLHMQIKSGLMSLVLGACWHSYL